MYRRGRRAVVRGRCGRLMRRCGNRNHRSVARRSGGIRPTNHVVVVCPCLVRHAGRNQRLDDEVVAIRRERGLCPRSANLGLHRWRRFGRRRLRCTGRLRGRLPCGAGRRRALALFAVSASPRRAGRGRRGRTAGQHRQAEQDENTNGQQRSNHQRTSSLIPGRRISELHCISTQHASQVHREH